MGGAECFDGVEDEVGELGFLVFLSFGFAFAGGVVLLLIHCLLLELCDDGPSEKVPGT